MTFHQPFANSCFDPVFPGSYDERFHNFEFPQEHRHSFHTYLPNLGTGRALSQDVNYYPFAARNVPYPSFSGEAGFHLPYANHAAVPNRFRSDQWTNMCNSETYFPMFPDNRGQLLNNSISGCYNMQVPVDFIKPDPAVCGYPQPSCEDLFGCNAGQNQQHSDIGFANSGNYMMTHSPRMQHCQFPAHRQPFCHKETVTSGIYDSYAVPHNHSIDEVLHNTSTKHRCEDSNIFGIQPSFVDDINMLQPTFNRYSSHVQPYVSGPSLDDNSLDTLFGISDFDTEDICVSTSESSNQSLAEFQSLVSTIGMQTEFVVTSSSCAVMSPINEVQASCISSISTTACHFVSQAVPEVLQSLTQTGERPEMPVTSTESINTSDRHCTGMEVTDYDKMSSQYSNFPIRTPLGESSAVVGSIVNESGTPLKSSAVTTDSLVTSAPVQFGDRQLQADSSEKTEVISAPMIPVELSVTDKCVTNCQELERDIIESDAGNCESVDVASNFDSSDDVIVLSPSPSVDERTMPVSANHKSKVIRTQYCRMQPAAVPGHMNTDHRLHSVLLPIVPKPPHVRQLNIGSGTVRVPHCGGFSLLPSGDRNFGTCRNSVLPSHANHIASHDHNVRMTSQRLITHVAVTPSQQVSGDVITCISAKPLYYNPPVTVVCTFTRNVPLRRHSAQIQQRSCLRPLSLKHSLSEPKTSIPAPKHNNCRDSLQNSGHARLQRSSSHALPHHVTARHNDQERVVTTSQPVSSVSSAAITHTPAAFRTCEKQSQITNQKRYSILRYRRDGSSLRLQDMSLRKNETYSVRAASILLQRIKQAKLSDITSAYAARQHLLQRRLNSLPQSRDVIDLTGDDDDGGEAYTADTCEFVFARARRHRTRMPILHRPRPYFCRTGSVADVSSSDIKHSSTKETFAADRSLPFYRSFVQKLLKNFRFTSSGQPVKVWYQEILPPDVPRERLGSGGDDDSPASPYSSAENFEENAHMSETEFSKSCTMELLTKRQPVVLLKRLDQSELSKYGVLAASDGNEDEECDGHAVSVSDIVSQNLQLEKSDNKEQEPVSDNVVSTGCGQESMTGDDIERENVAEEYLVAKQTPSLRRIDELIALCRPVSVVLEPLDRIKIPVHQTSNKLCKHVPCCQNRDRVMPTESEFSVCDLSWTVTQIPRANKVPILIMRPSSLSALNAFQKKVTKKPYLARQLRTNHRCLKTNCDAGIRSMHDLSPESTEFNTSSRSILKKIPACRKLHFPSSVWGSKNAGHVLRRRVSTPETGSPCRISSKCRNQQSDSPCKLSANAKKTFSACTLTEPVCKLERLFSSVEHLLPSDSTPTNNSLTDSVPHDFVLNQSLPEHRHSSPSSTVEFLPRSAMDANSTSDQDMNSGTFDAFPKNLPSTDSLPHDADDLPDDYASSDSNTVVMSPNSSMDDLTIVYRSPLSDVFDDADLASDRQERLNVSSETVQTRSSSEKFDTVAMHVDQELKPTSYPDCSEVASLLYTATISESVQCFSNSVKSSTFPTQSVSCDAAASDTLNSKQLQPTPVMLIESVNHRLEKRHAINGQLSEFVDDQRNVRWLFPSLPRLS